MSWSKWSGCIVLFFILAGGLFLRTYKLNQQSYWMDEGFTVNAVMSQLQNGTDHLSSILDSGQRYFCPVYCYPTAVISEIFGPHPFSYRILAAIFGILFVVIVYVFTKRFFENKQAALLAAFLTAFSYWQIAWSRQARWYTMLEVFFWLSFLFFHSFLKAATSKRKVLFLSLTVLSAILAIATQGISYLLPILLLGWYIYEKHPTTKQLIIATFGALIFIVIAEFGFGLHFVIATLRTVRLNNNLSYYIEFYVRNYWPLLTLCIYGTAQATPELRRKICMVCAPLAVYLLSIATLTDLVQYRYLFHLTPIFYIVSAVITIDILAKIPNHLIKRSLLLIGISLFFALGLGVIIPKSFYGLESDDPAMFTRPYYAYTPQSAFTPAYETIQKRIKPDDIVISSHPAFNKIFLDQPGYWLEYGYLGGAIADQRMHDGKEYYVGAEAISSLEQLQTLMNDHHGYVVFDRMSTDGRIPQELTQYIKAHSGLIFYDEPNSFSQIWVYRF